MYKCTPRYFNKPVPQIFVISEKLFTFPQFQLDSILLDLRDPAGGVEPLGWTFNQV